MKKALIALFVSVVMIGSASAATPYRLVGAMMIVDQRNSKVESVEINVPAINLAVCESNKAAIIATGFFGGNYDYKNSVQRTYSLTCVNTSAP